MKISRHFTKPNVDVYSTVKWEQRTSRITNPDGTVVFEMTDAEIPATWSQLATDIMVSKYFRKAGVPTGKTDENGNPILGPEKSARQVIHRLAGCWRHWGETHGYFDTAEDAQAFYDELSYMLLNQMAAPNSPQWFNTGLNFAYGITGPAQGHVYCDPKTGELTTASDAYTHPQPHACFIQKCTDDLVNSGGIMDLWTREARLFKYGSGTGSNFSRLRGENEPLSGGGKSSGLMSFLKIGDRAAGAIKSGGTTRRAAKMVCLDLDHPDIESFVNWKVREELKVACLVEGFKHIPADQKDLARKLGLKLDFDFNGEAYYTVSGQNSNNSVRIPNRFFKALENDGDWTLTWRTNGKKCKTLKARDLWEQISYAAWRSADPGVQFDDTINQWHTCPRSGRINASNPCVTGDTRVLTPGGVWRRIDQMIHLPSRVVTNLPTSESGAQQIHPTEGSFPTGTKEVFELRTESGYSVKLTGDHKVWTLNRGWQPARELDNQDEICLPGETSTEVAEPSDAHFFQLAGLFLSARNGDVEALHLAGLLDPEQTAALGAYATATWGENLISGVTDDTGDAGPTHADVATATLTNRRLLSRIRAYATVQNGRPRLSDSAFTAGLPAQKHLLRALFTADAELSANAITLNHPSTALRQDIQLILLGFGIKSANTHTTLTLTGPSVAMFAQHIGFLDGAKQQALSSSQLATHNSKLPAPHSDRVSTLTALGHQQVFDLTEPATHSFIANGLTVHNCSEYMFLDDTACNLASLNVLTFYTNATQTFDLKAYIHAIRVWTVVLEISVLMASFPSDEIAKLSYRYRTLGLGYANLGAMLMQAGIPYDSERGRAVCAALTAILTGESYATSAELAKQLGPFPGYQDNKPEMLRVIRNHRRAAYGTGSSSSQLDNYESLDIPPVEINAAEFGAEGFGSPLATKEMLAAARASWDRALSLGEQHGYRNAQTTVIAPTGTIGLLMDCDTTGVEPDFALVKFKKLAGGGYFKIANQSLEPALVSLGYTTPQIREILDYVLGTLSLDNPTLINRATLKSKGLTDADLDKVERSLPGMFELGFAFTPWTLGPEAMNRLGIPEATYTAPTFSLLRQLGFTKKQIDQASAVICGRGTVEGAPHLKTEHLPVFDCANKCGKTGQRYIAAEGHIRMMAAAQPFISGAISKTINLPNEATLQDIKDAYALSWKLGLKANALYRDGSKLSQPLNIKSDEDADAMEEDDEENVASAKEQLAKDTIKAISDTSDIKHPASDISPLTPEHTRVVEKIVERIVERPLRRRLPDTRYALTHKFDVGGHEGYLTVGLYEDGAPGELFITMAKEGSTIGGLMDTIATLVSVSLQYGVPVESLVRKFEHVRFEPNGMTRNPEIPMAKSLVDYIFRYLAMEFIAGYRQTNAPQRPGKAMPTLAPAPMPIGRAARDESGAIFAPAPTTTSAPRATSSHLTSDIKHQTSTATAPRLSAGLSPLDQQGSEMQSDAPSCDVCGSITVRSGTCYKCQNCGNSMGCS
jgi:ribonucleoside-diphosphate reductase alpha chain